ncbi:MAG: hypothetical protein DCF25_19710 [Leptolyngbya foveolarum]|uniref:Uncharacterized protein n=1 Tax=Leptolyngbya foveolarum TaxID=47253 RepID=A0A2W4TWY2_9CYAN|nr:MAG: hypothetical protein DCF25_19710 [Leptolyngbya foveolarum]
MADKKGKYGIGKAKADAEAAAKSDDPTVTFTMNVRKSHRQWWAGQAKLQGKTMTDIATAALIKEFGLPPNT